MLRAGLVLAVGGSVPTTLGEDVRYRGHLRSVADFDDDGLAQRNMEVSVTVEEPET